MFIDPNSPFMKNGGNGNCCFDKWISKYKLELLSINVHRWIHKKILLLLKKVQSNMFSMQEQIHQSYYIYIYYIYISMQFTTTLEKIGEGTFMKKII